MTRLVSAIALLSLVADPARAACIDPAMLIFDASASMSAPLGVRAREGTRIDAAKVAVGQAVPRITRTRSMGLIAYGPGGADACDGVNLLREPAPQIGAEIVADVEALEPFGLTPMTDAVIMAAEAMSYRTDPAVIVLVTDGAETCGGDYCGVAQALSDQSAGLQIHVIGFQLPGDRVTGKVGPSCMPAITGGRYVSTETVDQLVEALEQTLGCLVLVEHSHQMMKETRS